MRARIPPEMSNYYCHPGKAGGSPQDFSGPPIVLASFDAGASHDPVDFRPLRQLRTEGD